MLQAHQLRKRFGDRVVLDDLDLDVAGGSIHGFVGRNGAGKTTTMRIVLGLLAADAGEVRIDGRPITTEDRRAVGYLPEERGLYDQMPVAEQITYFGELAGMTGAAARASTEALLARLGIEERATDRVQSLSLGNQQRVQLGVALVHGPSLLVMDEPFSGLDPIGVDLLAGVLREEAARGTAILFSSHQLELVERECDAVTIIDGGRVVAAGSVDEVRRAHGDDLVRVGLDGGWTSWADSLPGATVAGTAGDDVLLRLRPGGDDQEVLAAAMAAGRVRTFGRELPSLTELFREVVAARPPEDESTDDDEEVAA
jgi:ABC-2 type transport system ATP-binding protein